MASVVFSKVFGLRSGRELPWDRSILFSEFSNASFNIFQNEKNVEIRFGQYGVNEKEREKLSITMHPEERGYYIKRGPSAPALLISLLHDFKCELKESEKNENISEKINIELEKLIIISWRSVNRLLSSIRKKKYDKVRPIYRRAALLDIARPFTLSEFTRPLFYKIEDQSTHVLALVDPSIISELREKNMVTVTQPADQKDIEQVQTIINDRVPFTFELILNSWQYHFEEDYRMAIINSAIALENELNRYLEKELTSRNIASNSAISRFIEDTSNKYLLEIIMQLLRPTNKKILQDCKKVFEIRNEIMHGPRREVKENEAREAILSVETFYNFLKEI